MSKNKTTKAGERTQPDQVGRKYKSTRFGLHSRRLDGDGNWYGRSNYRSEEDALADLKQVGRRYENVGGITVDFGPATDLYEYRIVKLECDCEVLHTETRKI